MAAIAACGIASFDYVLTGGPDWNPLGADAAAFTLVSSAAAAEHTMLLPASLAALPAPELPTPIESEAPGVTHDPRVSANDLLGAPVYAEAVNTTLEIMTLIEALHQPSSPELGMAIAPALSAQTEW